MPSGGRIAPWRQEIRPDHEPRFEETRPGGLAVDPPSTRCRAEVGWPERGGRNKADPAGEGQAGAGTKSKRPRHSPPPVRPRRITRSSRKMKSRALAASRSGK